MNLAEYKAGLKPDLAWDIATTIFLARHHKGLSQKDLANLCKMKQPSIARLESGKHLPTVRLLKIVADALNLDLKISLL